MSIKTDITTPENTLNYMKYVEIVNDTRFPPVTGGKGQGIFNKSAVLVQPLDPLNLGLGDVMNTNSIEKFGANLNVESSLETIWEPGGIYEYLDTALNITAVSDVSTDSLAGTGVHEIEIQGLDSDYNAITEIITMHATDGTIPGPPSTLEFLRVYRARVVSAGSTGVNDGHISIYANGIQVISIGTHGVGVNREGFGQSQLAVYTIPAGKTGYLTQWTVGSSTYNSGVHAYVKTRLYGSNGVLNTRDVLFTSQYSVKDYKVPIALPEKTDIEIRAYNNATGVPVSTTFNIVLIDN